MNGGDEEKGNSEIAYSKFLKVSEFYFQIAPGLSDFCFGHGNVLSEKKYQLMN